MEKITFNGKDYPVLEVFDLDENDYPYTVTFATLELKKALEEATESWTRRDTELGKEAWKVDERIVYYVDSEEQLRDMSKEQLLNLLK